MTAYNLTAYNLTAFCKYDGFCKLFTDFFYIRATSNSNGF
jgi:hypothetical protein